MMEEMNGMFLERELSWGNQDVLLDGNTSKTFSVGLNPTTWHNILVGVLNHLNYL